jgi:two-component system, sensor histidine kinase LadS
MTRCCNILFYLTLLFLLNGVLVNAHPIQYSPGIQLLNIEHKTGVFLDATYKLTIDEVVQKGVEEVFEFDNSLPNIGPVDGVLWCYFEIQNLTSSPVYLQISTSVINHIDVYQVDQGNTIQRFTTGNAVPFAKRKILDPFTLVKLNAKDGEVLKVYIRMHTLGPLLVPMTVGHIHHFYQWWHYRDLLNGIVMGFFIMMFFYNLFIAFITGDRTYFFYVLNLLGVGFTVAVLTGLSHEFIFSEWSFVHHYVPAMFSFSGILAVLFVVKFLQLKKRSPKLYLTFKIVTAGYLILIFLNFTPWKFYSAFFGFLVIIVGCVISIIAGIDLHLKGFKPAKFFLMAWGVLLLGVVVSSLAYTGFLPLNTATSQSLSISASIEMLLLSFALGYRINVFRKEKEEAQQTALQALKEKERLVLEQNIELEKRVMERTVQLEEANEELRAMVEEVDQTNELLNTTIEELEIQKKNIETQHKLIAQKNHDIMDSIHYGQKIQSAMLPSVETIRQVFPESYVFFKPRDVVSGDFYYFYDTSYGQGASLGNQSRKIIMAAIDCTGHGVPGAFMSMIANDLLNEIIQKQGVTDARQILQKLDQGVIRALRQEVSDNRDGMDMSLCVIDPLHQTLEFAGAKNPLLLMFNGKVHLIKGENRSIGGGGLGQGNAIFSAYTIKIDEPACIYLFSDGFQDQFGGRKGKKFMVKNFRNLLFEHHQKPFEEQRKILEETFFKWKSDHDQVDDILVMGFKIGERECKKLLHTNPESADLTAF